MKTILLWDPRSAILAPKRLTLPDEVASAAVRSGIAAAANPGDQGALQVGGAVDPSNLREVAIQHGIVPEMARVWLPDAVIAVAAPLGIVSVLQGSLPGGGGVTPPSPNAFPVSMNLNTMAYFQANRPFTNLALGSCWSTTNNSELRPPMPTDVGPTGDLLSMPAGSTWSRALRQPDSPGGVSMTMYWEDSQAGVDLMAGPNGSGFTGLSTVSTHGAGYKRTFTQTWTTDTQYGGSYASVRVQESLLNNGRTVKNLIVCESAIFDAYSPPGAPNVAAIPIWHDPYVTNIIAMGYKTLRFGDMMDMNNQWHAPITANAQTVARATVAPREARQIFNPGTNNQSLCLGAQVYFTDTAYFIARTIAPSNPFAENGNLIAITINLPSASPGITVDDTVPGEISIVITPDSGAANPGSASAIAAQVRAHAVAKRWIIDYSSPSGLGNNSGTTPIGAFPKTYLAWGTKGHAQDGIPWSWIINLCQRTGCKPWFTFPMLGTQAYWEAAGDALQASGLASAWAEMGNEIWNFNFVIGGYVTIAAGKAGITTAQQQGAWHNERMAWIKARFPAVDRVLSSQAAGIGVYNNLRAVTGVLANTDSVAIAPYFSHDAGCWTTPTATADIVVAANQMELAIPTTTGWGTSYFNQAVTTDGKKLLWYEGQQHNISGQPDLATFQAMQRAPRMKRSMGIWLSEHKRLCPPSDGVLFIDVAPIGPINSDIGAFGMKESFLQDISAAPKMQAAVDAKNGIYPAYMVPGTLPSIPSILYAGTQFTITVPPIYNQVGSPTIVVKANGGAFAGTGGNTTTPTPAAGDIGKTLTAEVTVSNGTDSFTYVSNVSAAVRPATRWQVILRSDLVGGQFQLRSDFNPVGAKAYALAAGGNGRQGGTGESRGGGGVGGYSRQDSPAWVANQMVSATIDLPGTGGVCSIPSIGLLANGGGNGQNASGSGGGAGGAVGTGTFARAGLRGGHVTGTFRGGAAGGSAGGPDGQAGNVADVTAGSSGGSAAGANGGANATGIGSAVAPGSNNRFGTGAGAIATSGTPKGGDGVNGGGPAGGWPATGGEGGDGSTEAYFTDSVTGVTVGFGSGGAGGGGSGNNCHGGDGGDGAGGGASGNSAAGALAGSGGKAWIVVEYVP